MAQLQTPGEFNRVAAKRRDPRTYRGQRPKYGDSNQIDVEGEFRQVAGEEGVLGDPKGMAAYCYIRVSSEKQSEDGRSGLPRQIQHIDEVACKEGLYIPWDMVSADAAHSGFEFENRPALTGLRQEVKTDPRSRFIVFEHLDRLSRNAKWHQGFLLDEFERHGMTLVFWKPFGSEIERAVLGTISEEGMRTEIARMHEGTLLKAQSGRVTAKRPAYGYMFVDSDGQPSPKARTDTHYAFHPERSKVMRFIYDRILHDYWTLGEIADWLNRNEVPTRFNAAVWCPATLAAMIKNPVYKGEFYANRYYHEKTGEYREDGRPKRVTRERPRKEWILVKVPATVTPDEWERAREIVASHQKRSSRNMKKREWLLSSFARCDICGYAYNAIIGGSKNRPIRYYGCKGRDSKRAQLTGEHCQSPYVRADFLEQFVWDRVAEIILDPEIVISYLEQEHQDVQQQEYERQFAFLGDELDRLEQQDERWRDAYLGKVISLDEFKGYRDQIAHRKSELAHERGNLEKKLGKLMTLEQKKEIVLQGLEQLRQKMQTDESATFEEKRKLLGVLLDEIYVDSERKTIRFEGIIRDRYDLSDTGFDLGSIR